MFEAESSKETPLERGFFSINGRLEASVASAGAMLDRVRITSFGQKLDYGDDHLTKGEIAILRFLTAIELIESDLWQQYDELGGATEKAQNNYQLALQSLNRQGSKFITANVVNEIEHFTFLTTCLESEAVKPLRLDEFRILPGSTATGSQNIGRLTNLMHLNIDTNWYFPSHSDDKTRDPRDLHLAQRPAIPRDDSELDDTSQVQAMANTAAFHFRYVEQEVSNLYTSLGQRMRRAKVLRIILGIGGQEIAHFLDWSNFAFKVLHDQPFKSVDADLRADQKVTFPNFNAASPRFSRGASMRKDLSPNWVVRHMNDRFGPAVATIRSFTENGLFHGQQATFLRMLTMLAEEADAALGDE